MVLDSFFNAIFGSLINWDPLIGLLIICFLLTLIITVAYKYLTDQELMKSLKKEIKDFQEEMKEFKDDPKKALEIQKRAMEKNMKYMLHSFKPTLFTFIPLIIIFSWLKNTFSNDLEVNFLGIHSWFIIYIIFSIVFSMLLRKILRVH